MNFLMKYYVFGQKLIFKKRCATSKTHHYVNSLIRVANQPVFFEKWSNKSISCIKNLLDDSSKFLTLQAFSCKYKIKVNFLDYYGLLSAIRKFKSRSCLGEHNHQNNPLRKLLKSPKISKKVYKILIDRKASIPFKSQDKWKLACGEIKTQNGIKLIFCLFNVRKIQISKASNSNYYIEELLQLTFSIKQEFH